MTGSGRIPPTPDDDDEEWMATFSTLPDDEIDLLLRGESASSLAGGLTDLMQELRADVVLHGAPPMNAELRAQITRPVAMSGSTRRRRLLAGGLGGLLLGGATMGVAAAQDVLPAPIQDVTASVAGVLGVELPRANDRDTPADERNEDDGDGGSEGPTDTTTGPSDAEGPQDGPTDTTPAEVPSTPGPSDSTPGGAVPADPGSPGDKEPATPATPATGNGQGNGNSGGNGEGNGNGQGSGTGQGNNASENGQANGKGTTKP